MYVTCVYPFKVVGSIFVCSGSEDKSASLRCGCCIPMEVRALLYGVQSVHEIILKLTASLRVICTKMIQGVSKPYHNDMSLICLRMKICRMAMQYSGLSMNLKYNILIECL